MIHTDLFEKSHGCPPKSDITGIVRLKWSTGWGRGPFYHSLYVTGRDDLMCKAEQFKADMEEYTNDQIRVHLLPS